MVQTTRFVLFQLGSFLFFFFLDKYLIDDLRARKISKKKKKYKK